MGEQVGIPYARALVDEQGYGVRCPFCGQVFRGLDESQESAEDALSKGANQRYAEHYQAQHPGQEREFEGGKA
jgi:hypothetical protein